MANLIPEKITQLSDREHVLKRSGMYVGGIKFVEKRDFFLEGDKFVYSTKSYIPGLIKIIFEAIDNAVDVAIKSNFAFANKISINVEDTTVTVKDNGYGISQEIDPDTGLSSVFLAVGTARAGSNFDDDKVRDGVGQYGIGIYLSNVFSKKFVCTTCDGKSETTVSFANNSENHSIKKVSKKSKPGTTIYFEPDLEKFGIDIIDEVHKNIVKQRLNILAVSYPEIEFKFNDEKIKIRNSKQFAEMFGKNYEIVNFENGFIAYYPTTSDEFNYYTVINGQVVTKGGTHVTYINNKVLGFLRDKLVRKYKDIKPSDIRNKLMLVSIFRKFPNATYTSQVKEELSNSATDITKYLSEIDFDSFGNKIYKNSEILELITEMYRIREEFQKQKDMQKLNKKKGKVDSTKYTEPIGEKKYLMIVEGDSALGGLLPELGRKGIGYFAIRGKMLNVIDEKMSKISANVEIESILNILDSGIYPLTLSNNGSYYSMTNEGKEYIIHENDSFKKGNKWVHFSSLDKNKYIIEKIDRSKIDPIKYFTQKEVNQPYYSSYDYIGAATDADLDAQHIRGLILTLFNTLLLPLLKAGKLVYLNTPVIAIKRNNKIFKYFFNFEDYKEFLKENPNIKGEWKYYKGLGSWAKGELKELIDKEGLDHFITKFEYDDNAYNTLVSWMSGETSNFRKEHIRAAQLDVSDA